MRIFAIMIFVMSFVVGLQPGFEAPEVAAAAAITDDDSAPKKMPTGSIVGCTHSLMSDGTQYFTVDAPFATESQRFPIGSIIAADISDPATPYKPPQN